MRFQGYPLIMCGVCKDDMGLHLEPVTVTTGTKSTTISGDGDVTVAPGGPGGLGRGSTVSLRFYCEDGHAGLIELKFHKGQVLLEQRWTKTCVPGLWDDGLWRD